MRYHPRIKRSEGSTGKIRDHIDRRNIEEGGGGGRVNVPIKEESLNIPTPTLI
jgi:hypothetical protein